MHRRMLAAVFVAIFALPTFASAQVGQLRGDPAAAGTIRITPFIGYLTAFTRSEEWLHDSDDGVAFLQSELRIAGGEAAGLVLDIPVANGFGVTAAAAYGSRGDTEVTVFQTEDAFLVDGHRVFLGRLGVSYRMPQEVSDFVLRRLGAAVFAGGTMIHEQPRVRLAPEDALDNATHFGVNLGLTAELPFAGDRLALQVGVEDNITWWNESALASLPYVYLNRPGASPDQTRVSAGTSHQWLLRAGVSVRLF
jgi:hypothetical protein